MTAEPSSGFGAVLDGYCAPMRREDWAARLTDTIAREVVRYRKLRGMTAQQVVDACAAQGLPMKRTVLVNLETGRRGNITLSELIVLAAVLKIPPLQLVFPVGHDETVELLPDRREDVWRAAQWFTGEATLAYNEPSDSFIALFRQHTRHYTRWLELAQRARTGLAASEMLAGEVDREAKRLRAERDEALSKVELHHLRAVRQKIVSLGLTPPALGLESLAPGLRLQLAEVDELGGLS